MNKKYTSLEERIRRAAPAPPHLPKSLRTRTLHHASSEAELEIRRRRMQTIAVALMLWLGLSGFFFIALPRPSAAKGIPQTQQEAHDPSNEWGLVEYTRKLRMEYARILNNAF